MTNKGEENKEDKKNEEDKKTLKFIAGFLFLAALSVVINLAISLKLVFSENIIEWVSSANNPIISLWIISALVASVIIILIQSGAKLSFLKIEIPKHPLFSYLLGLPVGVTLFILIISAIVLAFFQPVCESPAAIIDVTSLREDALIQYDGESIHAKTGAKLTLKAVPGDNAVAFCSWTFTGDILDSIGPISSCTTQLHLSNQPSQGIILLTLTRSFCSVKSTVPLNLSVEP